MKTNSFPRFKSLNDVVHRYNKFSHKILFENREYTYADIFFRGHVKKLVYRCDREQHNLIISMMGDVVVNAAGVYSIGDVAV